MFFRPLRRIAMICALPAMLSTPALAEDTRFVILEPWSSVEAALLAAIDVATSWPETISDLPTYGSAFASITTEPEQNVWRFLIGEESWTNRAQAPLILNWARRENPPPIADCRRFGSMALQLLATPGVDWMGAFNSVVNEMELDFRARFDAERSWSESTGSRALGEHAPVGAIAGMDCFFHPRVEGVSQQGLNDAIAMVHQQFFPDGWSITNPADSQSLMWFSQVDATSRERTAFEVMLISGVPGQGVPGESETSASLVIQIKSWYLAP